MRQLALALANPPPPTLENFVAGRNSELIHNLRRLARGDAPERFIYVWGFPGSGRSHLLKGMVAAASANGLRARYAACVPGTRLPDANPLDCCALDDVERLDPEQQLAAFHLHNALREHHGSWVAAGAVPPVQLPLRSDLVTRLGWGLVYQVHALADEDKARALADHAALRGFRLPPEVCEFLLTRGRRDMASLIATLEALDRHSLETKRPVTVPMARQLLAAGEKGAPGPETRDPGGAG